MLAKYKSDFYKDYPAVTLNISGKGKAYYIAFRDTGDFSDDIVADILKDNDITCDLSDDLPYGVTAHSRTDGKYDYIFLENYNSFSKQFKLHGNYFNIETEEIESDVVCLGAYEVKVLKR